MKNIIAIFFSTIQLFFMSCSSMALVSEKDNGVFNMALEKDGKIWLDSLCCESFQGRKVGTEGNQKAYEYLNGLLLEMGYTPSNQVCLMENGRQLHNIIVAVPGVKDSLVIVGAHFDGANQSSLEKHYQAANDNGSGVVALLLLLKSLKEEVLLTDKTIVCCFWDGEEYYEGKTFRGSTSFVENKKDYLTSHTLLYINLDTVGHNHDNKNEVYMEYLGDDRMIRAINNLTNNERFHYYVTESSFNNSDYVPFRKINVPFINYHDHYRFTCAHPNHSLEDTADAISISRLVNLVHNVRETIMFY